MQTQKQMEPINTRWSNKRISMIYQETWENGQWKANSISKVYRSGSYVLKVDQTIHQRDRNTSAPNSITNAMGVRLAIYIR